MAAALSSLAGAVATWIVSASPPLRFGLVAVLALLVIERARPGLVAAAVSLLDLTVRMLLALLVLLPAYLASGPVLRLGRSGMATVMSVADAADGAVTVVQAAGSTLRTTLGRPLRVPWRPVVVLLVLLVPLWYAEPALPRSGDWAPVGDVAASVQSAWTPVDCWVSSSAARWAPATGPAAGHPPAAAHPALASAAQTCGPARPAVPAGTSCAPRP